MGWYQRRVHGRSFFCFLKNLKMSPLHLKSGVDLHCTFNMIVKSLLINLSHSFCKKMFVNLVSSFRVNVDNVTEFDYWNSILAHSLCLFQSQNLYKKKKNQIVNKCKNPTLNPKPCLKALLQNGNLLIKCF